MVTMAIYVPENVKQSQGRGQSCYPLCSYVVCDAGDCWRSNGSTSSKEWRKLVSSSRLEPSPLLPGAHPTPETLPSTAASMVEVPPAWCRAEALASAIIALPMNPQLGMGSMLSRGLRHCRLVLHDHLCQVAIHCLLLGLCL